MPRKNLGPKLVAHAMIREAMSGKLPSVQRCAAQVGYSPNTVKSQTARIVKHPDYQKAIAPLEEKLDELIADAVEIVKKQKAKATYRDGIEGTDKLTKLRRLLVGESTENNAMSVSWTEKE